MGKQSNDIAIIGMAGRFPGAGNLRQFWDNLETGVESISRLSEEEIAAGGIAEDLRSNPDYVRAVPRLDDVDYFDAEFFAINPREAEILDPQHRVLLECTWEALENAGYDPDTYEGRIGIYAGASMSSYLGNLSRNPEITRVFSFFQLLLANDKDHLTTRVAYKLNLKGPAVGIQSACSTSLVAVNFACDGLLNRSCEMAIAAGVMIRVSPFGQPQELGYLYQEGGLASRDGHCRPFDARAQGTIFGNGAGVVVLKPLANALDDGDFIHAVIKGSAVNNDGSTRVGYTAPSVEGQAAVVAEALAVAGVSPESVGYVEAHGTGTPLGDPIEIQALHKAFRARTNRKHFCGLGSVKANIGHLETAAGIAGLIKTVLALRNKKIPPHLHFETPNPIIDLSNSPFFIPVKLTEWRNGQTPRRAGVSSFGMGGTNAHVIVEEAPQTRCDRSPARPWQLLQVSARSRAALETATDQLASWLAEEHEGTLADAAYTLRVGRRAFPFRRALVCRDKQDAIASLASRASGRVFTGRCEGPRPAIAFLFPGQGTQYAGVARGIYEAEPLFRDQVDYCAKILRSYLGNDLRDLLFPAEEAREIAEQKLSQTLFTQPALFVIEYALAQWMMIEWGIKPAAFLGHSIGEYVAATISGVFSLPDALVLVAARARLVQELPPGAMLAVAIAEPELLPLLGRRLDIASVNGKSSCVVSGPIDSIQDLESQLKAENIACRRLNTSHGFHSRMMEPAVGPLTELASRMTLKTPTERWISNASGSWITADEAVSPAYWGRHLRKTVRFADGLNTLAQTSNVFVEVGPGGTLSNLVRRHSGDLLAIQTVRSPEQQTPDMAVLLQAMGSLWLAGIPLKSSEKLNRIPLPTYPFERKRYWIFPARKSNSPVQAKMNQTGTNSVFPPDHSIHIDGKERISDDIGQLFETDEITASITTIWRELLGSSAIDQDTSFFESGGDSLLATQMMTRLREHFHVQLSFESVFTNPTINALACKIRSSITPSPRTPPGLSQSVPRGRSVPLSFAQQRLFFLDQLAPGNPLYNVPVTLQAMGMLDTGALAKTLDRIVARHEVLRTTFVLQGGKPVQQVHRDMRSSLSIVDLESWPEADRAAQALRLIQTESVTPFNLAEGPLVRARLLPLCADLHYFVVTMHHIICDGWSMGVLLGEFASIYTALTSGSEPRLEALPIQYGDFALWQRDWLTGDVLEQHLSYWTRQLSGLPTLSLQGARPIPAEPTFAGAQQRLALTPSLTRQLHDLGKQNQATTFMVLLAIFNVMLHYHSGQEDIPVGTDVANRTDRATEQMIGFFVNQLVLRTNLSGNPSFQQIVQRVRQVTLAAYDHQELPFDRLVEALNPPRNPQGTPLFQVKFVLQNTPVRHVMLPGLQLAPLPITVNKAKFDILVNLQDTDQTISGSVEYSTERFEDAVVAQMMLHFEVLASHVAQKPDLTLAELSQLLAREERQRLSEKRELAQTARKSQLLSVQRKGMSLSQKGEES